MKYNKLTSLKCTFCTCVHCEHVYTVNLCTLWSLYSCTLWTLYLCIIIQEFFSPKFNWKTIFQKLLLPLARKMLNMRPSWQKQDRCREVPRQYYAKHEYGWPQLSPQLQQSRKLGFYINIYLLHFCWTYRC